MLTGFLKLSPVELGKNNALLFHVYLKCIFTVENLGGLELLEAFYDGIYAVFSMHFVVPGAYIDSVIGLLFLSNN